MELQGDDGWCSGPVFEADRFLERWRGLRPAALGRSMLLRGDSVHGFGMRHELVVAALDRDLEVIGVGLLRPRRLVWFPGAIWMLEMPPTTKPPLVGSRLRRSA